MAKTQKAKPQKTKAKAKPPAKSGFRIFYLTREELVRVQVTYAVVAESEAAAMALAKSGKATFVSQYAGKAEEAGEFGFCSTDD